MKPSVKVVIADSGPLIALARLELLEILPKVFESILVPGTVVVECTAREEYPEGALIQSAIDNGWITLTEDPATPSPWNLDAGETGAIAIALEQGAGVLMDDQAGRRVAQRLGLHVIGTAGVLVLAKRRDLVVAVRPHLEALAGSGYFLSEPLMKTVLRLSGEK